MDGVLLFAAGVALGILVESVARRLDEEPQAQPQPEPEPRRGRLPRVVRCGCGVVMVDGQPTLRYIMAPESEWPQSYLN